MVKEMDAGDVFHQVSIKIDDSWKTNDLMDALGDLAAKEIVPFINSFDNYSPIAQDLSKVSFANKISKETGYLDFSKSAEVIHHQCRAFDEEPGCRIVMNEIEIKVFAGRVGEATQKIPSTVTKIDSTGLYIACNDKEYIIKEIQVPGKKRQTIQEFIQGNRWIQSGDQVRRPK